MPSVFVPSLLGRCAWFVLLIGLLLQFPAQAARLQVGPAQPFTSLCDAVAAAREGDTIELAAGASWTGESCRIAIANLTLRSTGEPRARLEASSLSIAAPGTTIEGLELYGVKDGAAIRVEEGFGVIVRNSYIHDNTLGLVTGASTQEVVVRNSEFARNASNITIGQVSRFTLTGSYSHDALGGTLVTSRAVENLILYNRLTQEGGQVINALAFPHGGNTNIIGNVVEQDAPTAMLAYLSEGAVDGIPGRDLLVVNNTFVQLSAGARHFITGGQANRQAVLKNNIFQGYGSLIDQPAESSDNFTGDPEFVDPEHYDYRLRATSPAINAGADPSLSLAPRFSYLHPTCAELRLTRGVIDIGAYEFGGGTGICEASAESGAILPPVSKAPAGEESRSAATTDRAALIPADISIVAGAGTGTPGGTVTIPISLAGTTAPAGLQWTLSYPSASVAAISFAPGIVATAASKSLRCSSASGTALCVLYGLNTNTLVNGVIANVTFQLSSTAPAGTSTLTLSNPMASTTGGDGATITSVNGSLTVNAVPVVAVTVSPASVTLGASGSQQFSATVTGSTNTAVTWSISPATGSITTSGLYTAPSSVTSTQTVTVRATSVADTTKFATATVTLSPAVAVTVSPTSVTLGASGSRQFSATVTGSTNTAVTWSISPATGSITTAGLYTAPSSITSTQTVTVRATSVADTTKYATATVTLSPTVAVTVSPASVTLNGSQSQQFSATVTGSTNTAVTWSISPSTGSISAAGLYTAPASVTSTQTVTVRATSVADSTKFSTATVTLAPVASAVAISVGPSMVTLSASQTQQFSAVVTGSANTSVTWSITPSVGTISAAGLYTAPSSVTTAQTLTIRATSVADATKFATATVNLLTTVPGSTVIRVNAGGAAYTDPQGRTWSADTGFDSGGTYAVTTPISGADAPALYQSVRWSSGSLGYSFNVPNGTYLVNLRFAEIYFTSAGQRVFNVDVNGQRIASSMDVVAVAGGANRAVDRQFTVNVTTGRILIQLVGVVSNPNISALEVIQQVQPGPTTFTPIRVNAGGGAFTDSSGRQWSADSGYDSGFAYGVSTAIAGADAPALYQTLRWNAATLKYEYTVPNGTYQVNLKFAEVYFSLAGQRVFHVDINGQRVLPSLDIVAVAGGANRAVDRAFSVAVTAGKVTIQLVPVVSNPQINAIEITQVQGPAFAPIRINAGGAAYTDSMGRQWAADAGYDAGSAYTVSTPISGADAPAVYQSLRWNAATLKYEFTVPNGTYQVNLKFAEVYFASAGQRIFHIDINGQRVVSAFDTIAAAGGANRAVDRSFTVSSTTGKLTIQLVPLVSNPQINGIEIIQSQAASFTPVRINAGGAAYTDSLARQWSADTGFDSGFSFSTAAAITGADATAVYQSVRWAPATLKYEFTVPNGSYQVNLKFAEVYFTSAGQRMFHIDINGQRVLANFDAVAAAGGMNRAVDRLFPISVTGSKITIQLVPVVSNPNISGIEIY